MFKIHVTMNESTITIKCAKILIAICKSLVREKMNKIPRSKYALYNVENNENEFNVIYNNGFCL